MVICSVTIAKGTPNELVLSDIELTTDTVGWGYLCDNPDLRDIWIH